jgi:hypothetical protein
LFHQPVKAPSSSWVAPCLKLCDSYLEHQLLSLFNCLGIFTAVLSREKKSWRERTRVLHFVATRRARYSRSHTLA